MLQEKRIELFSVRYNFTDFSELTSRNKLWVLQHTQARAFLPALAQHFGDTPGIKLAHCWFPLFAQRGVEEKLSQQGYPMISSFLSKTARL